MQNNTCSTCIFWEPIQQTGPVVLSATSGTAKRGGFCHRYPPQSHLINLGGPSMHVQTMFPGTDESGWCGEHQKQG